MFVVCHRPEKWRHFWQDVSMCSFASFGSMGQTASTAENACRRRWCPPAKRRRLLGPSEEEKRVWELLTSPGALEEFASSVCCDGLREAEVAGLIKALARKLSAPQIREVDCEMLFARFDVDSDGLLDKAEVKSLLRAVLFQKCKSVVVDADVLPRKRLRNAYQILRKLGEGGQGAMYLAQHRRVGAKRCVKFYPKGAPNAPIEDILFEFEVMKTLDSPHVARTYEIFQDGSWFYIVSEPYTGGDLTKLVASASAAQVKVTEEWLSNIFSQVLKGLVFYIPRRSCTVTFSWWCTNGHDLKESNVMVAEDLKVNFQNPHVILIDFGLSSTFLSTERGIWGTPGYIPPETFVSLFWVPKGDIFSAGVMFYQILSGRLAPFAHPSTPQTHSSGGEVNWDAVEERTRQIDLPVDDIRASVSCKSMLKRMTSKDFKLRPTARECLELPWFSQAKPESLVAMAALDRLKALQTRSAPWMLDKDGDGVVTKQEAQEGLREADIPPEMLQRLVGILTGPDGTAVEYSAFMAQMIGEEVLHEGVRLWDLFCELDLDGDGYLTREELPGLVAACKFDPGEAERLLLELDSDGDGRVSFQEFKSACLSGVDLSLSRRLRDGWLWPW
eukprot:s1740_g14.t4